MYRHLFFLLMTVHAWQILPAQDTRNIRFREESPGQRMSHFYITAVKDDRADTGRLGELKLGMLGRKAVTINLEHGATQALKLYLKKNYTWVNTTSPVELHITSLQVKELSAGLRPKIEVLTVLTFFDGGTKLIDLKNRGELQSMGDLLKHTEDMIRQQIRNSLLEFDEWWGKNKSVYSSDAPVALTVAVEQIPTEANRIGYAHATPLTIDDFLATPDAQSKAAASTASGITLKYASDVEEGMIKVKVLITPYFNKERSWFRGKVQFPEQVLQHEQKHFDITALIACELADTLRQEKLTRKNYQEKLEAIHARKQSELAAWQRRYDAETAHGTEPIAQDRWRKWVNGRLADRACYR